MRLWKVSNSFFLARQRASVGTPNAVHIVARFYCETTFAGIVGIVLTGAALQTGQRYSIWLFLLRFCLGVFACVRASSARELQISKKDS